MEPIALSERLGRWSAGRGALFALLAARLRRLIDDGELPPGTPLPPDRALAASLSVGRATVVAAYDVLRAEGRIVRRQGSGTRVAGTAGVRPDTTGVPMFLHLLEPGARGPDGPALPDGVVMLACAAPEAPPPEVVAAYAEVPERLARLSGDIGYHPAGIPELRRALAERYTLRGLRTEPEQIMVTNGGQQALALLARAFVRPGDLVYVEAPTFPGAVEVFHEESARVRTLPVGLAGLSRAAGNIALAYAVTTFHNPTGAVLPVPERRRLAASPIPLVDDEVLADLAFPGVDTPPPLAAFGAGVLSVGSLSKVVWGGLRVGWVRAPVGVVERLARLRAVFDLGGDVPAQMAAAALLPGLDGLRRREAAVRKGRHDHLRAELAASLPEWDAPPVPGGQTLWVRLPRGDGTSFAQVAMRYGVVVLPGPGLDAGGGSADRVRLHFMAPPAELSEAVRRLAVAWRAYG